MLFHFKNSHVFWSCLLTATLVLQGCGGNESHQQTTEVSMALVQAPTFQEDSAYHFVQKQVDFGPRVPNTSAHKACGDFLVKTLSEYGFEVTEQKFSPTTYDGKKLNARNIIGSFNPSATKRILLSSHWDSRPYADQDSIPSKQAVPAANDGASGVGVLLEIARVISTQPTKPNIGVDIIFFDAEDWGNSDVATDEYAGFCLGSQYWAANKHQPAYTAYFGILLDMVGAKGATFQKEGYSMQLAGEIVRNVWNIASLLGYSNYFIDTQGPAITDDHLPVNKVARIPMIDIIHTRQNNLAHTFFDQWHTSHDTMEQIDPQTLKAVGQTLLQVLYQEAEDTAL
ncbi:peptidase M28-like protein [Dyadobacter jejuensis]|uniref:Peptidase M28-like protein n=1 Tax=Dyadobacter jejuensis TaxID=1082580 RepID=A0A316A6M6_9BACT|nr:M28 family peptidase [Dyadobacter jejuensis]PWJ53233.1 peptidase M28-like protein [Dyadobacter jejuensis]